ncbi:hypothetical protein B5807_00048 [Epicoccum nigrum]|uniref:Uncharacterized protein n=1 Tax=Epicoccum nigrum TaxID=105696 RepID=A0A1Y2MCB9_EPING|nr:hypothetical protein B5807_00048 [Epicoccum nigrum]
MDSAVKDISDAQDLIPEEIVSPHPWRRIFVGCYRSPQDGKAHQLWLFFGVDPKSGEDKDLYYLQPNQGQQAPREVSLELIDETVPKELTGFATWKAAAWNMAQQTFPLPTRRTCKSLQKEQDKWKHAQKKQMRNLSESPLPEKEFKKRKLEKKNSAVPDDNPEALYDDAAIQRAWNDFPKPCSRFVTQRMALLIQARYQTKETPTEALLNGMRHYGKCTGSSDNPDRVYMYHGWVKWMGNDCAPSRLLGTRANDDSFYDIMQKGKAILEEMETNSRLRKEEAAAAQASGDAS